MQVLVKYKNELNELITRLAAARTASSDGKIGFAASEFELITSVLESAIDFQPVIPQADRRGLIRDALFATGREAKPDAKLLEDHLKRCEVGYLQRPLQAYVLASAMGIRNYYGRTRIRINGVEVSFHKSLPTKFNRTEIGEQIPAWSRCWQEFPPAHQLPHSRTRKRASTSCAGCGATPCNSETSFYFELARPDR